MRGGGWFDLHAADCAAIFRGVPGPKGFTAMARIDTYEWPAPLPVMTECGHGVSLDEDCEECEEGLQRDDDARTWGE